MDDFEIKLRNLFDKAMISLGLIVPDEGRGFLFALYMSGFTTGAIHGVLGTDGEIVKLANQLMAEVDLDKNNIH